MREIGVCEVDNNLLGYFKIILYVCGMEEEVKQKELDKFIRKANGGKTRNKPTNITPKKKKRK